MPASIWRVDNSTQHGGEVTSKWQANHAYSLGARCVCSTGYTTYGQMVFECTDDGTSGGSQPTWTTTAGNTVTDGGVVWTARKADDGSWDNATCYLQYVLRLAATGDSIYINDDHAETASVDNLLPGNGSISQPIKVFCVDKADDSLSEGAICYTSTLFYGYVYSYGVHYKSASYLQFYNGYWIFEGSGTTIVLEPAGSNVVNGSRFKLINASIQFNGTGGSLGAAQSPSRIEWNGGSVICSTGISYFIKLANDSHIDIRNVDLTQVAKAGVSTALIQGTLASVLSDVTLTRCKLPSDGDFDPVWALTSLPSPGSGKFRLHHCSSDNATYDFYEASCEGVTEDETTLVRTGGASDGTTLFSFKMTTTGDGVAEGAWGLESPPIHGWTASTTEKTFTIECLVDSATNLQDDEIWMELEYPADGTSGLGAITTDKCAMLDTPADQTDSSETWTTTGMANPNTFKLSVTVTPGKAGPITARVYLAKLNTTVYVDPIITES